MSAILFLLLARGPSSLLFPRVVKIRHLQSLAPCSLMWILQAVCGYKYRSRNSRYIRYIGDINSNTNTQYVGSSSGGILAFNSVVGSQGSSAIANLKLLIAPDHGEFRTTNSPIRIWGFGKLDRKHYILVTTISSHPELVYTRI